MPRWPPKGVGIGGHSVGGPATRLCRGLHVRTSQGTGLEARVRFLRPSPSILATASLVLSYRMLRGTPPRNAAVQEGLGGLGRIGLYEASVAVGQVQDEAVGFLFHPADDHQGLAKVALGVARRMGQGHEHLLRPAAMLPHVVLDYGVLAAEPMLVPESLEDPLGCVALLPGMPEVVYQDLVDDAG